MTWFIVDRVGLGFDQLASLDAAAWTPRPLPFLAASALLLAAYGLSAALWGRIVRDLGGPDLPVSTSVQLFMIANLGRYVPGKVWQIAGLAALGKSRGVPPATGTAAAVLGQGIALVAASALGMGAFLTGPEPYRTAGLVGAVAIGGLVLLLAVPGVFSRLAAAWFRLARTEAPEALGAVHGMRWLALYTVNWVMYVTAFWGLCASLDLGGGPIPLASAFAAAYVLGYLMLFAPAGLGPREAFLVAFLTPHIGPGPSGLVAVVQRLWTTLVEVVPAGIFWSRYVATAPTADVEGTHG